MKKQVWTTMFGKPVALIEETYHDDYGSLAQEYTRKNDGSTLIQHPTPLELFPTKALAERAIKFKQKIIQNYLNIKF